MKTKAGCGKLSNEPGIYLKTQALSQKPGNVIENKRA
jgi:hypothetical protein